MSRIALVVVVLIVVAGGAYLVASPPMLDRQTIAMAEALASHTRALQTALAEECEDAEAKLREWRRLREAGTPASGDTKQARRMLRKLLKEGCSETAAAGP